GLTAGGAIRVNIDRWIKYGNRPNNIGGIVQISYSPQPAGVLAVAPTPAEAPPAETAPAPAPAAVEPAPPPVAPVPAPVVEPPPPAGGSRPGSRRGARAGSEGRHDDDRRGALRQRPEPPDEHREGYPGRRRAQAEEQPVGDLQHHRLHRPEGEGEGPHGARPR